MSPKQNPTEETAPWGPTAEVVDVQPVAGVDFEALAKIDPNQMALTVPTNDDEAPVPVSGGTIYLQDPDLDMSDLYIPKLRLANGLSSEVNAGTARPGQWVLFGHEAKDTVNVVVLGTAKRRELREKTQEAALLCSSDNAKEGIGVPGGSCLGCPLSQPVSPENSSDGRYHPAPCNLIYSYQVFSLTHNAMAILEFKKTATNAAKQLNTILKTTPARSRVIILGKTQQQNAAKQSYYVPTVLPREITDDERAMVDDGMIEI